MDFDNSEIHNAVDKQRQHEFEELVKTITEKKDFTKIKDSGQRHEFSTGAHRDLQEGKGLPCLIPTYPLRRLAVHFELGSKKYGVGNFLKGIPSSSYINSAYRHLFSIVEGDKDEDHYSALLWNIMCLMNQNKLIEDGKLPKEIDDMGLTDAN